MFSSDYESLHGHHRASVASMSTKSFNNGEGSSANSHRSRPYRHSRGGTLSTTSLSTSPETYSANQMMVARDGRQQSTSARSEQSARVVVSAFQSSPASIIPKQKLVPKYQDVWEMVWLRHDIRNLTKEVLSDSEKKFDHGSASLLLYILETQIIYQQYLNYMSQERGSVSNETELRPDVLLSCDDVVHIITTFSKDVVPYSGTAFNSTINRGLQFRVLASALSLLQLLGTTNLTKKFHDDLNKEIIERLKDIKNARVEANRCGRDIFGFGDAELFAHFSLDILSQMPSDVSPAVTIVRGIANLFFAVGLAYTYNIPSAIDALSVWGELPTNPEAWYKPFHELYAISLGAICLSYHARAHLVNDASRRKHLSELALKTARSSVKQIDQDFRGELSRLTAPPRKTAVVHKIRTSHMATNIVGPESERWSAAFGMLFIVNILSETFGRDKEFCDGAKDLAVTTIKKCTSSELAMLRFKAFEVLISLEESSGHPCVVDLRDILPAVPSTLNKIRGKKTVYPKPSPEMKAEAKSSEDRFGFKRDQEVIALRFSIEKMKSLKEETDEGQGRPQVEMSPSLGAQTMTQSSPRPRFLPRTSTVYSEDGNYENEPDKKQKKSNSLRQNVKKTHSTHRHTASPWDVFNIMVNVPWRNKEQSQPRSRPSSPTAQSPGETSSPIAIHSDAAEFPGDPHYSAHAGLQAGAPPMTPSPSEGRFEQGENAESYPNGPQFKLSPSLRRVSSRSTSASEHSWKQREMRRWVEVMPMFRVVQAISDKRPKQFDFKSTARSVVLSPDKRFAIFVFEKKLKLGRLGGFPPGTTKIDTQVVKAWTVDRTIKCVALSSSVLVVAAESEVKVFPLDTGQNSHDYFNVFINTEQGIPLPDLNHNTQITAISVSRDSNIIAVGQRIDKHTKTKVFKEGVIQLYQRYGSGYYSALSLGRLSLGESTEPANVTIAPDGRTVLCSYAAQIYIWRRKLDFSWKLMKLPAFELSLKSRHSQGVRGITSITVFSAPAVMSDTSSLSPDLGLGGHTEKAYCIVTAILSGISGENMKSNFITPLDETPKDLRCYYPEGDFLCRSAISDAGDLAAFLTDCGQLKISRLASADSGYGLQIKHPERLENLVRMGPKHQLEPKLTANIGIRTDGSHNLVVGVARDGTFWETRLAISRFNQQEREPAELATFPYSPSLH